MTAAPTKLAVTSSTSLQIPGDGIGSSLTVVVEPYIVANPALNQIDLAAGTSVAVGQLVITNDGYWATVTAVSGVRVTVDKWKKSGDGMANGAQPTPVATAESGVFTSTLATDKIGKVAHGLANGTPVYFPTIQTLQSGVFTTVSATDKIGKTGHGLTNGTAVIFQGEPSIEVFGVFASTKADDKITQEAHGLVDTDQIMFTDGDVPAPLVRDTIYYVVSAAADDFQVALTSGGAAINITGPNASNLRIRQPVASTLVRGTTYFVISTAANDFEVSATVGGAKVDILGADATSLRVIAVTNGNLPAPLSRDVPYFVISTAANDFEVSLTQGGAKVDITGPNVADLVVYKATNIAHVFPSGSILANHHNVLIEGIHVFKAATATADFTLYGCGSTALLVISSVVGVLPSYELEGWKLPCPFMYKVGSTANLVVAISFKPLG